MAPLPDLPPMPPVPREELAAAQGRPYPKAPDRREPVPDEPSRTVITVRSNRRLALWGTWLGWLLTPVGFALSFHLIAHGVGNRLLAFALTWTPMFVAVMCTVMLAQGPNLLTYDTQTGQIGSGQAAVQGRLNRWKQGDRIEYSVYLGQLRIVRQRGRPRLLIHRAFNVNRSDWIAFVDVFLAHQNARAEAPHNRDTAREDATAARPPEETGSAIKVGVRWRCFLGILLIGLALATLEFHLSSRSEDYFDPVGPLGFGALLYLLIGAVPLLLNPTLIYESGQVSVKTRGRALRRFPRRGGDRLEYSLYDGALFEVRGDGRRRRIATGRARDQAAWKTFVDRFAQDHPESIRPNGTASAKDESGEP
ncbi:hypothetical protein [Glycomyces sp. NRRL B-16210]|uniref:hypothetical protein n=1 Tax=Glycomyces sp. NRRL B-16210 TaxID=1463821 RepID=UPI0004C1DD44|nr:hypothetical protein [Glycomyces sp. NRRL B-16210]